MYRGQQLYNGDGYSVVYESSPRTHSGVRYVSSSPRSQTYYTTDEGYGREYHVNPPSQEAYYVNAPTREAYYVNEYQDPIAYRHPTITAGARRGYTVAGSDALVPRSTTTPIYRTVAEPVFQPSPLRDSIGRHVVYAEEMAGRERPTARRQIQNQTNLRRSLIIGINYIGQGERELFGCISDAMCIKKFLELQGWPVDPINCRVLLDDDASPSRHPTAQNIKDSLKWLTFGAQPGDALFFGFSGHGAQIRDYSGDETDGLDEAMVCSDGTLIPDDVLYDLLVKEVPMGVKLTCIIDACHSATLLDLPYVQDERGYLVKNTRRSIPRTGHIVMFSACQDSQVSDDVTVEQVSGGACVNALLTALSLDHRLSYRELASQMTRKIRARGLQQLPVLSSSTLLDLNSPFSLSALGEPLAPLPRVNAPRGSLNPLQGLIDRRASFQRKPAPGVRSKNWLSSLAGAASGGGGGGGAGGGALGALGGLAGSMGGGSSGSGGAFGAVSGLAGGKPGMLGNASSLMGSPMAGIAGLAAGQGGKFGLSPQLMQAGLGLLGQSKKGSHPIGPVADPNIASPSRDLREQTRSRGVTGNRKSLLIGINYIGQQGELRGCINDVKSMLVYIGRNGYPTDSANQMILTEEQGYQPPTRANMEAGLRWLVQGAKAGDNLFLHYSGHGTSIEDDNGDEADKKDEALVPLDYQKAGVVRDDWLYINVIKALPKGARLFAIFDCCHSGSALDLPYMFRPDGVSRGPPAMSTNPTFDYKLLLQIAQVVGGQKGQRLQGLLKLVSQGATTNPTIPPEAANQAQSEKLDLAEVYMISGCQDSQTSADVGNIQIFGLPPNSGPGGAGGACTNAFLSVLQDTQGRVTWADLIQQMRSKLIEKKFSQVPELSSTCVVKLTDKFELIA